MDKVILKYQRFTMDFEEEFDTVRGALGYALYLFSENMAHVVAIVVDGREYTDQDTDHWEKDPTEGGQRDGTRRNS